MATGTGIEWTQATWNPLTGCTKVSPGCKHCYAERMSRRLQAMGASKYVDGFRLALHDEALNLPLRWATPRLIFVNSMSDLFHERVPLDFIQRVFAVMRQASWHTFQVLTKRSERLLELDPVIAWPDNVWVGVSVETAAYLHRVEDLRRTNARLRFLSLEPLLGPLGDFDLTGIAWAIAGGESGPGARPMDEAWVVEIRDRCLEAGVPFFFKQWGGVNKKRSGRLLQGRTWDDLPRSCSPACLASSSNVGR